MPTDSYIGKWFKEISPERYEQLDKIYHCESASEIKMLDAVGNYPQLKTNEVCWLIDTYCYHAAYWPHTLPRYQAFLDYIKTDRIAHKRICSDHCINFMRVQLDYMLKKHDSLSEKEVVEISKQTDGEINEQAYLSTLLGYAMVERVLWKDKFNEKKKEKIGKLSIPQVNFTKTGVQLKGKAKK